MADTEEPQFVSLKDRMAALNQSASSQTHTFGKRPPPPIPSSRPAMQPRGQTTNNPLITTYGSSVTKQANNQPMGAKNLLPPPPIDRDSHRPSTSERNQAVPARNAPPPLPGRKASQPMPAPPSRRGSTQLTRKGSNSSMSSTMSGMSGMSLGHMSSASSIGEGRKLPPRLEDTKLPSLPPSRREQEEKARAAQPAKIPLVKVKSAPNVNCEPPVVERDPIPKLPTRPSLPARPSVPPRVPSRPVGASRQSEEPVPVQPARKLPPPTSATRSALSMGFNNKKETQNSVPRAPDSARPSMPNSARPSIPMRPKAQNRGGVQELTDQNFDSVVNAGTPVFVKFYSPHCTDCTTLEPVWKQLGEDFAFASDQVLIAKINHFEHARALQRFRFTRYPALFFLDGKSQTPTHYTQDRDLESLTRFLEEKTGISVADGARADVPPPINMSSKPGHAEVQAIIARPSASTASPDSGCLRCRDFSAPDHTASQYPRDSLPRRGDMTAYLADVLCSQFSSFTDKARAIFTWLHHNVAYDTVSFFGGNVKYVSPADVITSGLAVCGGYAGLYVAIALKAGLECVMVTGHGKGFGNVVLKAGDPIPPCKPDGHAWNAVRIDGGEWKLIDACWGAGHITDHFTKQFTPSFFTMSNDEFGIKHFPQDAKYFFRSDGQPQSWEKYMIGPAGAEALQLYSVMDKHGLSETSFTPPQKHISVNSNEVIRFQFSNACPHWNHERNGGGKPYLMVLTLKGKNGGHDKFVAMESNEFWYWLDVKAKDLGSPGQSIGVYAVSTVEDKDARGLTKKQYDAKNGKVKMGPYEGICSWELA